jgi:D-threo-aldose 1-dehydrogenase
MAGMAQRRLGRSGLELTELGFGGAPLGALYSDPGDEVAADALAAAFAAGVRYVDTAPFYGHGLSEHRVGAGLRRLPGDAMVVSTKVGRLLRPAPDAAPASMFEAPLPFAVAFDYSYEATMRSLEDSYQRMGRARIDIALIHDCNPRWHGDAYPRRFGEAMEGAYRALDELRQAGVVRAVGVGVNDPEVCLAFARAGRFDCFMLAGRYTLLDQSGLDELLPHCEREGIGILLAAPFNSGILATGAVDGARFFYEPAPPAILQRVSRIEAVCRRHDVPLAAAALRFPLGHPAVTSVVVGCRDRAEVLANADLVRRPVPEAFWAELKAEALLPKGAPTGG